jgi:serine/threonine protein kinase
VKVIDFGFARAHDQDSRPKTMCGTDDYMAPEVVSILYVYHCSLSYWNSCGSAQKDVLTNLLF